MDNITFFPTSLDLVKDGPKWLHDNFPVINKVIVFDKDETLISSTNAGRILHQHLIANVVLPAKQNIAAAITVLYTVSSKSCLLNDFSQFPFLAQLFDLVITGDNFTEELMQHFVKIGKLQGNPRTLEWERVYKPVTKIFHPARAVLIDDYAGTIWSLTTIGYDGIKAYPLEDDSMKNALAIWDELEILIQSK